MRYSNEETYSIRKYACENGATATVPKFKRRLPKMNKSTVQLEQETGKNIKKET